MINKWRRMGISLLYSCAFLLAITVFGYRCPIYTVFGFPCPGCGMTSACLAALRFDFARAWEHNPTFVLVVPMLFVMLYPWRSAEGNRNAERVRITAVVVFAAVMTAVWVVGILW